MGQLTDRLERARELAAGRRVLDIGGKKMPNCDPGSAFARVYAGIQRSAREYRIVDCQDAPEVDYRLDLNRSESLPALRGAIDEYRPEVILCMDTLEHINCHFEVMNEMAGAVTRHGTTVFITVPNNANWVFNALGWNSDHSIAFLPGVAERFVKRSDLGRHEVTVHRCMQTYLWYWRLVYVLSFCQPFNWGFTIRPRSGPAWP